jgi:hypothetical protein
MLSERPQRSDHVFDFIILKEADASDSCSPGFHAQSSIFSGYAAKGEDRNFRPAGFA